MKKVLLSVLAVLVLICGGLMLPGCTPNDKSIDKALADVVNEINAVCPITVDSETRLDNCVALPGKNIRYNYTLVNFANGDLSESQITQIKDELRPSIINQIKSASDMQKFRDYEVTIKYVYKSNDSFELFSITVAPKDYK